MRRETEGTIGRERDGDTRENRREADVFAGSKVKVADGEWNRPGGEFSRA